MEEYVEYLIMDINAARARASFPNKDKSSDLLDWIPEEEEDKFAPVRSLEEWTGISACQLPEPELLNYHQLHRLLEALKEMLDAYNCSFVLQTEVPEYIQYQTLKYNFNQRVKVKQWHTGYFELCRPGTEHGKCILGRHCQCAFYEALRSGFKEDDRTPEEQQRAEREIEVRYIRKKHGDAWMKYYPYDLDPDYDDENRKLYGYRVIAPDDDDNRWRKRPHGPKRSMHSVIVHFQYGRDNLEPMYELESRLMDVISRNKVGEYDGHEIAMDNSDGSLYMYGPRAELLFHAIKSTLASADFMTGAIVTLRFGPFGADVPEIETFI